MEVVVRICIYIYINIVTYIQIHMYIKICVYIISHKYIFISAYYLLLYLMVALTIAENHQQSQYVSMPKNLYA